MPITFVYQTNCCCPIGSCCAWVVPAGVTSVVFEIWGGGGGAGGGLATCDCCQRTGPGGGGGYAARTIPVTPGDTYTVCAGNGGIASGASTGNYFYGAPCGYCQNGCPGNVSFVVGTNLTTFCATGGCGGCSNLDINCYGMCGCQGACGGQGFGGEINENGDSGARFSTGSVAWSSVSMGGQAGGPGGGRGGLTPGTHNNLQYGDAWNDHGLNGQFPGGGGSGHGCSSDCSCFAYGAGRGGHGLVKITW